MNKKVYKKMLVSQHIRKTKENKEMLFRQTLFLKKW